MNRNSVATRVRHGEVELPITIEVTDDDGYRAIGRWVIDLCCKGAVAVAEKDKDSVATIVCHDEVLLAVTIEITNSDGPGTETGCVIDLCGKGSVAVAEQN